MKKLSLLLCALMFVGCGGSTSMVASHPTSPPVVAVQKDPNSALEPRKVVPVVPSTDWQTVSGDGFVFSVPKDFTLDTTGNVPVWVAPDHLIQISVESHDTDKSLADYVAMLTQELTSAGISVLDQRGASMAGYRAVAIACGKGSAFLLSFVMVHQRKAYQFVCGLPAFSIKEKAPVCLESGASVRLR